MDKNGNTILIPVHSIVEANGKTIKENNLAKKHNIPLNAIVEAEISDEHSHTFYKGKGRFYVVAHTRDCDGTPLYSISLDKTEVVNSDDIIGIICNCEGKHIVIKQEISRKIFYRVHSGYNEELLKLISLPE